MSIMISVVIPVYNEENSINNTIKEVKKVLKANKLDRGSEIIVVNDGSTDKTKEIVEKTDVILINNPVNTGYGYSLKKGIEIAKNNTIVITDADSTYPFDVVPEMLKIKQQGFDLVVGARTGKNYKQSFFKSILRKVFKALVEYVSGKKIKDINSGLRVFDKSLVIKYFPRLCNTFSFTTSQTLSYLMNNHFVTYVDIDYRKREGKSKVRIIRDSFISLKYILESCIYYDPLKIFTLLSKICIFLSLIGFMFSHFLDIHAGYILGIGGLLLSIVIFSIGLLAIMLKQIIDRKDK